MQDDIENPRPLHPMAAGVKGVHHTRISTSNLRAVLRLVATMPGITNAEISRRSGLGAQTVSRFLLDLENSGLIRRGAVLRGNLGQPATPYTLAYDSVLSIGVEIGWRRTNVVLVDMHGEPLERAAFDHALPEPDATVERAGEIVRRFLDELPARRRKQVIGLGLAAPFGRWNELTMLGGDEALAQRWAEADLKAALAAAGGLAVTPVETGGAASWGEFAGPHSIWTEDFLRVDIGLFICSGTIRGHALGRGRPGPGIGGLRVPNGDGRAALLGHAAGLSTLRAKGGDAPAGPPEDWDWRSLEAETRAWISGVAPHLAAAMAGASDVAGTDLVILGGAMPDFVTRALIDAIEEQFDASGHLQGRRPRIEAARAGPLAAALGAAYRPVYEAYFAREENE